MTANNLEIELYRQNKAGKGTWISNGNTHCLFFFIVTFACFLMFAFINSSISYYLSLFMVYTVWYKQRDR